ncbi:MAG: AtpZ/AtpI family protein [Alphaproteobacteria bacterium]|nr:AtpZ/AtpI family protein [Alphaproteobacteria bacterium]
MDKIPEDIKLIDERIKKLKAKEAKARKDKPESQFAHATKTGFRVGTELVSGVIVGAAFGYILDKILDTRPLLLIIFLFFGGIAGFLNVYRFVKSEETNKE